ncbi:MAG TPA: protein-L-isoaspartate(D-aspartate) O-methyltransferase [Candidatus Krumholzibacteria bacterium]|nr:protein-L-isoaspartate(D-aspartate) O-methyltransferase [Candidatus Krumholzibacteria bacterium]
MRWRQYKIARERMVREHVYARGIRDPRVIDAMLRVPRHLFIGRDAGTEAYADHSYPIGFRQTMSQPYMVAYLSEQLRLDGDERVLEIGTGSGYHAAVLANLSREVCTIERVPELAERARALLRDLLITNVTVRHGDGAQGWNEGVFDRVILTAAARHVPRALLSQVADGGFLIGPVMRSDNHEHKQEIVRLTRRGGKFDVERLIECSFVPLVRDARTGTKAPARTRDASGSRA